MRNESNLIPINTREDHRSISRKGGIESGKSRGVRKKLRESLDEMLSDEAEQDRVCRALIRQAQKGNVRAFQVLAHALGEDEGMRVELSRGLDSEERRAFIESHAELLEEVIRRDNEAGNSDLSNLLQLSYEERRGIIQGMMEREARMKHEVLAEIPLNDEEVLAEYPLERTEK